MASPHRVPASICGWHRRSGLGWVARNRPNFQEHNSKEERCWTKSCAASPCGRSGPWPRPWRTPGHVCGRPRPRDRDRPSVPARRPPRPPPGSGAGSGEIAGNAPASPPGPPRCQLSGDGRAQLGPGNRGITVHREHAREGKFTRTVDGRDGTLNAVRGIEPATLVCPEAMRTDRGMVYRRCELGDTASNSSTGARGVGTYLP